ncbi:60S ribosomal protein L6 [Culex quinquefasciatus]|uniref:60S ribosomal protein L6 n=1 Tax=Culex quinquefasciatus TaxID=7176 RepID=B0XKV7_CULQU|nr:60S ribosomal protein L6 [Culex quinquefasciatus]|eukprot:XP_001870279.1 60S ribosomal protein L6 [Culex quinquefasciatus]
MRRFTKGKIAARKALYSLKMVRTKMPKVDITAVKKIGSAKNGCEHKMLVKKNNSYLPTKSLVHKRSGNRCFRNHKRNNRNCSRSRKRIVLLMTLKSGLLLVTGPFALNSWLVRRVSQNYVIATTAHVDLRKFNIPKHIKDGYFRRARKKTIHTEKDIFKRATAGSTSVFHEGKTAKLSPGRKRTTVVIPVFGRV